MMSFIQQKQTKDVSLPKTKQPKQPKKKNSIAAK